MFLNKVGKPTKIKKLIYLITWVFLGILLSFILHALVETSYLYWSLAHEKIVIFYGGCALHPIIQTLFLLLGTTSGFFLGLFWWQKVYLKKS